MKVNPKTKAPEVLQHPEGWIVSNGSETTDPKGPVP